MWFVQVAKSCSKCTSRCALEWLGLARPEPTTVLPNHPVLHEPLVQLGWRTCPGMGKHCCPLLQDAVRAVCGMNDFNALLFSINELKVFFLLVWGFFFSLGFYDVGIMNVTASSLVFLLQLN